MPTLKLDFLVVPTYNTLTLGIIDASTYPTNPPSVNTPWIEITPPGFDTIGLVFSVDEYNIFTSSNLGLSPVGVNQPLPDGIYHIKYSVTPAYENFVEKSIIRTDRLQERFDEAFMRLDMMECDSAIKTQSKVELDTIYYFIQGAIAAANNCATIQSSKLYDQASRMLNHFMKHDCGCTGNNYINNFK